MDTDSQEASSQDQKNYVKEMVRIILYLDHSKRPFTKADIAKFLSKPIGSKNWAVVLENTKRALDKLGYRLLFTSSTGTRSFILVNKVAPLPSVCKFAESKEIADRTLLTFVLAFIFMKGGCVTNVNLFDHLEQLNIYKEENPVHPYFGDVKNKIMREFISQLYLEKTVDKNVDTIEMRWGERARAEVSKRSILKFVCEIGYEGKVKPENFTIQYQEVLSDEEEEEKEDDVMETNNT